MCVHKDASTVYYPHAGLQLRDVPNMYVVDRREITQTQTKLWTKTNYTV